MRFLVDSDLYQITTCDCRMMSATCGAVDACLPIPQIASSDVPNALRHRRPNVDATSVRRHTLKLVQRWYTLASGRRHDIIFSGGPTLSSKLHITMGQTSARRRLDVTFYGWFHVSIITRHLI